MSFASATFFLFLAAAITGCAVLGRQSRIRFLLVMSLLFYSAAYPPHVLLLLTSCIGDYWIVALMVRTKHPDLRRGLIVLSLAVNLGLLATFKYSGFFATTANQILAAAGTKVTVPVPSLLLPVGISFYTFQTLSYTIDVYRGLCQPARSFSEFAMFVSFFPHLAAGPILRARDFLPQIRGHEPFQREQTVRGIELMLFGFFKKCVVADNCAPLVNQIFSGGEPMSGSTLWIGCLFFAAQIYGDFSGYSDIARGLGYMFGFRIPVNFEWPYFSRSMLEFWQRWHITLSSFIRDYVYIPLGIRVGRLRLTFNVLLVWLLCGLWHGAAWKFVLWGLYHGALVVATHIAGNRIRVPERLRPVANTLGMGLTFVLVLISWIFFRSADLTTAWTYLREMLYLTNSSFFGGIGRYKVALAWLGLAALAHAITYVLRYDVDELSLLWRLPYTVRLVAVTGTIAVTILFSGQATSFIYFQF